MGPLQAGQSPSTSGVVQGSRQKVVPTSSAEALTPSVPPLRDEPLLDSPPLPEGATPSGVEGGVDVEEERYKSSDDGHNNSLSMEVEQRRELGQERRHLRHRWRRRRPPERRR